MDMRDWSSNRTYLFSMFLSVIAAWIVTALSGGHANLLASVLTGAVVTAGVLMLQDWRRRH